MPGKTPGRSRSLIASGDFGYLPAVTIASDGTIYAVFNNGRNRDVDIGGLIADPSGQSAGAVTLTPAEGGITARASIALDHNGTPWVVYMHQPEGSTQRHRDSVRFARRRSRRPLPPDRRS